MIFMICMCVCKVSVLCMYDSVYVMYVCELCTFCMVSCVVCMNCKVCYVCTFGMHDMYVCMFV